MEEIVKTCVNVKTGNHAITWLESVHALSDLLVLDVNMVGEPSFGYSLIQERTVGW